MTAQLKGTKNHSNGEVRQAGTSQSSKIKSQGRPRQETGIKQPQKKERILLTYKLENL